MANHVTKTKVFQYILYSLRIRRVEYRIAELPIYLIPVLLSARDASVFTTAVFWEGLLIFLFLFAFGDLLNCLADRELDAIYKPHLTEAVLGIGSPGVVAQAVLSAVAAVGLSIHLCWLLKLWFLPLFVLVGVLLAWSYSIPPVRLKGRGLWQLAFYWLGLFSGPMLFAAILIQWPPDWMVIGATIAFGMAQTGVILVNTAEDYPEDRHMEVRTVIVALGLQRGLQLSFWMSAVGSTLLLIALGVQAPPSARLVALAPLGLSCLLTALNIARLCRRIAGQEEQAAEVLVKRAAVWTPAWITSVAVSTLWAAAMLFVNRSAS